MVAAAVGLRMSDQPDCLTEIRAAIHIALGSCDSHRAGQFSSSRHCCPQLDSGGVSGCIAYCGNILSCILEQDIAIDFVYEAFHFGSSVREKHTHLCTCPRGMVAERC